MSVRRWTHRGARTRLPRFARIATAIASLALASSVAAVEYDAVLEWNGPYLRAIRSSQDQAVDQPVIDIAFDSPFAVAAREHDGRDLIYVVDSGNRRVQAFEANATHRQVLDSDLTYRSSGTTGSAEWSGDEIRLPEWAMTATHWVSPGSEEVVLDGVAWTRVADLAGYEAGDRVYTLDYDAAVSGPRILFPATALEEMTSIRVSYLVSDNQTGAAATYGIGDVDYGIGEGSSPVLVEIDGTSGGPTSFQTLRAIAVGQNEVTNSSDDLFLVDSADDSGALGESLFQFTIASDGTVNFVEAFGDSLQGPFDVAVARAGASTGASVTVSSDDGLFDQGSAVVVDANQVTGHTYRVESLGNDIVITDQTTGRTLVSQTAWTTIDETFHGIPGVALTRQTPNETITVTTVRADPGRYLFVAETDRNRVAVVSAAAGPSFSGDWLPLDARAVVPQPSGDIGALPDVDHAVSTPGTVPANWVHRTVAYPIAEGSLDSLVFAVDGAWHRVDSFSAAGPTDKVFTLDAALGRIRFGNGTQGAIPPAAEEFTYAYAVTPAVLRYGSSGSGNGQFLGPKGIAARWNASLGAFDVYVADTGNDRIQKLAFYEEDPALGLAARMEFVTEWSLASGSGDPLSGPFDVVVARDTASQSVVWVAVADTGHDRIVLYRDTAASQPGGGTTAPTFELTLGGNGTTLGSYQLPTGLALLPNGEALDLYVADASRGVVAKYERAPAPSIAVDWEPSECRGPSGSYTFLFTVGNPPPGGWVDFYFDTASAFDEDTARLAFPSGTVAASSSTAVWDIGETPGGSPGAGTYFLFARLYDSEGELLASDSTSSQETLCIDLSLVPTLALRDALDGDSTLSFQSNGERIFRLAVTLPDSVVSVSYNATFDPTLLEVVSITRGTAWEGTGATSVLFESNADNVHGSFEITSSALDTPIGLTGAGPHTVADVKMRVRPNVLDLVTRFVDTSIEFDPDGTEMVNVSGAVSPDLAIADLAVRIAYLGDIATTGEGADGTVPRLAPNPDGYLNFADVVAFSLGWNGLGPTRDPIADLGPASGTPPHLVSEPDGRWTLDDILVLTQMYSWAREMGFTGSGSGRPDALRATLSTGQDDHGHGAITVHGLPARLSAGQEAELVVETNAEDVLAASLFLELEGLRWEALVAEPGSALEGREGRFSYEDVADGGVEVVATRLGAPRYSGSPELARVRVRALSDGVPRLRLYHDVRDGRGAVLASGAWESGTEGTPSRLRFFGSRPNPVRDGRARLEFATPSTAPVRLSVVDAGGRLVQIVLDQVLPPGRHEVEFDAREGGRELAPGVYFVRLDSGEESASGKLIVTR